MFDTFDIATVLWGELDTAPSPVKMANTPKVYRVSYPSARGLSSHILEFIQNIRPISMITKLTESLSACIIAPVSSAGEYCLVVVVIVVDAAVVLVLHLFTTFSHWNVFTVTIETWGRIFFLSAFLFVYS